MRERRRHGPLWVAAALGLAATAAACTSASRTAPRSTTTVSAVRSTTTVARSTTSSSAPTASSSTPATVPAGTPVPGGFEPASVTFVSAATGFVIGIDSTCPAGSCVALARTGDGGSSWVALPAPPAGYVAPSALGSGAAGLPEVSQVRFADLLDGWVYGPSLFATHDGGATWQQVDLGGSVISLEASGGYVDAVVSPCSGQEECAGPLQLYQARASGGAFGLVLTGPSTSSAPGTAFHLSLHAPVGFVNMSGLATPGEAALYATSSLAAGAAGWKPFPDPCTATSPGDFVVGFAAPDTTRLFTLCSGQGAAGSELKEVVRTQNGQSQAVGAPPPAGDTEALAATASGTLVVAAASGASWLYRSVDGGATWTTAETYNDGGVGFRDLGFTTSSQGVAIHGVPGPPADYASQLLMTRDGGATWSAVAIG